MIMDIEESFKVFGIKEADGKKKLDSIYNKKRAMYLAGKLSEEEWSLYDWSYSVICDYFESKKRVAVRERIIQKKILLIETEMMNRRINNGDFDDDFLKPLWVILDELEKEEFAGTEDELFLHIEEQILSGLDEEQKKSYECFLISFRAMWKLVYEYICECEAEILKNNQIGSSLSYFIIRMDELVKQKNEYGSIFEIAKSFSDFMPSGDEYCFMDFHFRLIANFLGIDYEVEYSNNCPEYYFSTSSRLAKYERAFLEQVGREVKSGVRNSPFVDNGEILEYIKKTLRPSNKYLIDD